MPRVRGVWLSLGFVFLALSFALLITDYARFVASGGESMSARFALLLPASWIGQVEAWASLEASTWGNVNRMLILPLVFGTPLWVPCVLLALIFRLLGRKPT